MGHADTLLLASSWRKIYREHFQERWTFVAARDPLVNVHRSLGFSCSPKQLLLLVGARGVLSPASQHFGKGLDAIAKRGDLLEPPANFLHGVIPVPQT